MLRKLAIFIFATLFWLLLPKHVSAENEFSIDAVVSYHIQENGKTEVTHDITLENNFSTLYATSYALNLQNIEAENVSAFKLDASGARENIPVSLETEGESTKISLSFQEPVVGLGARRHFYVTYMNSDFAARTGEIWEVTIPRLDENNNFRSYAIRLIIPEGFGLEAYMSPKPSNFEQSGIERVYTFSREQITQAAITAGFGPFQVFSFNLSYHLENPLSVPSKVQIAIPPDTAFQKVYFSSIEPEPSEISIDSDGNWLATYKLSSRQRLDVKAVGSVQLFSGERPFPIPPQDVLDANLKPAEFWQADDAKIRGLAVELKTPRAIYDYVSKNLSYNIDRVQPNVTRLGAVSALENPSQAICMEFTDTFIAIARAAGIPAREINGFAYTENPDLQPLGLVADVLHSWPEYYDAERRVWVPIDPTWASTTGGENFFDKLDLRHFAFVIHGADSSKPYAPGSYKLGPNPQKDVFVSFGKLPDYRIGETEISIIGKRVLPFIGTYLTINIKNPGPTALYNLEPTIYFEGRRESSETIELLPPYASINNKIKIPFSLLGKDTPEIVTISAGQSKIDLPTNKSQVVVLSLLSVFVLFGIIIVFILVRLRKISFSKFTARIESIYERVFRKTPKNTSA